MIPASRQVNQLADHLFRHESGKMVAVLSRILGMQQLDMAEDIVQDTLLQAMHTWSYKGLPPQPAAWLMKAAKNRAIDLLRRQKKFNQISPEYARLLQEDAPIGETLDHLFLSTEIADSQLRMIFACCHPSIPPESQVALTLKTLCGLHVSEIARAFLCPEETITKRIYRAKEKISRENIALQVPLGEALPERLEAVLKTLYLLFNEGYNSSHPEQLIREDLCMEAMRLCQLLTSQAYTSLPRTNALMALMCFQASRLGARQDDQGQIILLKKQDRLKWHLPLIQKGFEFLDAAAEPFEISAYHLEAAIASVHAAAPDFERTDWEKIEILYNRLYVLQPSPLIFLQKAIAIAHSGRRKEALEILLQLSSLNQYYLYHAALGEILSEEGDIANATRHLEKAKQLTANQQEQEFLGRKIHALQSGSGA